jgi:hypothetical protein
MNTTKAPSFGVLIPVGPGPQELERLRGVLESLFHYEPRVAEVVLIDDVSPGRDFSGVAVPEGCRLTVLANPRGGLGNGWSGGLTAGVLAALQWLERNAACDFVLKLDTDALVIAPFASKIAAAFQRWPDATMLGTYSRSPNRKFDLPEDFSTAPALRKLLRVLTVWRRTWRPGPRLQCTLVARDRKRAELNRGAIANGYVLGLHCQGGAYAVSAVGLRAMAAIGALADPLLWIWTHCCEDIVVTLSAFAAGGRAQDFNGDGEVFGVVSRGLPDALLRLVERGFSIVHSVKDFEQWSEAETRAFFAERRRGEARAAR